MKGTFWILSIFIICLNTAGAINLLSGPETVVFDSVNNRYLVSNMNAPYYIVAIDQDGIQSVFNDDVVWPHGMAIAGNTLYVTTNTATGGGVIGLDLTSGERVFEKYSSIWHNCLIGLGADTSGNVYVSCPNKVYRINTDDGTVSTVISNIDIPNGIHFDALNNRMLVANEINTSLLYAINVADFSTYTISVAPAQYSCITQDYLQNYYISAFFEGKIYRYDSSLSGERELIAADQQGPEGLHFNNRDNILAVPNLLTNSIKYLEMFITVDADTMYGWPPLEVNFTGVCDYDAAQWTWDFGDGDSAFVQSPTHIYDETGIYDVTLEVDTVGGSLLRNKRNYIVVLADTLSATNEPVLPNSVVKITVNGRNTIPLYSVQVPVEYSGTFNVTLDSFSTAGCRTEHFDHALRINYEPGNKRQTIKIYNTDWQTADLEPGEGPLLKLFFTIPATAPAGQSIPIILDGYSDNSPEYQSLYIESYAPATVTGGMEVFNCGDVDGSTTVNILDITYLIGYLYKDGPEPSITQAADVDGSGVINILDITYLISYLYKSGPAPICA